MEPWAALTGTGRDFIDEIATTEVYGELDSDDAFDTGDDSDLGFDMSWARTSLSDVPVPLTCVIWAAVVGCLLRLPRYSLTDLDGYTRLWVNGHCCYVIRMRSRRLVGNPRLLVGRSTCLIMSRRVARLTNWVWPELRISYRSVNNYRGTPYLVCLAAGRRLSLPPMGRRGGARHLKLFGVRMAWLALVLLNLGRRGVLIRGCLNWGVPLKAGHLPLRLRLRRVWLPRCIVMIVRFRVRLYLTRP